MRERRFHEFYTGRRTGFVISKRESKQNIQHETVCNFTCIPTEALDSDTCGKDAVRPDEGAVRLNAGGQLPERGFALVALGLRVSGDGTCDGDRRLARDDASCF